MTYLDLLTAVRSHPARMLALVHLMSYGPDVRALDRHINEVVDLDIETRELKEKEPLEPVR